LFICFENLELYKTIEVLGYFLKVQVLSYYDMIDQGFGAKGCKMIMHAINKEMQDDEYILEL